ncbi:hypothetical protein, partial [Serratia sp. CY39337]|uniref:hypothetical protein n=1 Tax=Serratia sp. CY39337 TaxID=3383614 RepID=UPI003FA025AE
VGAIARGQSGNLYFGANMEFSGAPLQQTIRFSYRSAPLFVPAFLLSTRVIRRDKPALAISFYDGFISEL